MNRQIPQLHVGHGTHFGALSVFPVWVQSPPVAGLEWKADSIRVDEREASPVVGELVLHNTAPRPVVVLEGDLLEGGWQDRMLARSIVLEPFEVRVVEVLCVEYGRWGGAAGHASNGRKSAPSVRYGNLSVRERQHPQHEVWRRIGRFETSLGETASASMLDHLDRAAPISLDRIEGQRGVIIGIGGRVVGAELFGSATGLRTRWQGILDAAGLDARLAPPRRTPAGRARELARQLMAMTLEDGGDAGAARELRSHQGSLRASGIGPAKDELFPSADITHIIHLTAFDDSHPLLENK